MTVYIRIFLYSFGGYLIGLGLPENLVQTLMEDPNITLLIENAVLWVSGLIVIAAQLVWRKLALKFGWSV